jgi:hypothetical protein
LNKLFFSVIFTALSGQAQAQAQTINDFNQRFGFCQAQTEITKKATCFEQLANRLLAALPAQALAVAPAITPNQEDKKNGNHIDFVKKSKERITSSMKDPSSVLYRNLFISNQNTMTLCGELNAKNSYGGYVGFRRFMVSLEIGIQRIEDEPKGLEALWYSVCDGVPDSIE